MIVLGKRVDKKKLLPVAAGAAAITAGMSLGVKDDKIVGPAFMGGWATIAYGINQGHAIDGMGNVGLAAIMAGGAMARGRKSAARIGKPLFLAGWATLAASVAKNNGGKTQDYVAALGSAATVVAGAMLIRKKQLANELSSLPAVVPPLVFALGWLFFTREASR